MLSYPAVSYSIRLMQSSSFRNDMVVVVCACFLLGCAGGITACSVNDSNQKAHTLARGERERGADAIATGEEGVAHGLVEAKRERALQGVVRSPGLGRHVLLEAERLLGLQQHGGSARQSSHGASDYGGGG
ncbi:hypothetical protein E2562_032302 [Oryza meyeriana var. granulata]|uniref:Uncharacterized protein n=1 Tax=Oryza meyeriana var. granulata TaxID=110450 RepID=A0A6G1ES16_9ORYZ|nr:hypothetical protein E2562_032302 [Oryza meyeriana var. granulata]